MGTILGGHGYYPTAATDDDDDVWLKGPLIIYTELSIYISENKHSLGMKIKLIRC